MGCQASELPQATKGSPSPAETSVRVLGLEQEIIKEAKSWQSPEQAWGKIHPECDAVLSDKNRKDAKANLRTLLGMGQGKVWALESYTATPSAIYHYPIAPTHLIRAVDGLTVCMLHIEDENWYLVVSKKTAAGEKMDAEFELSEDEQLELAHRVVSELTPQQRAQVLEAMESGGKVAGIKALRQFSAHRLRVHKLVVEELMKEL